MTDEKKNNCQKIIKNFSKNYWAISTIILAILLLTTLLIDGNSTTMNAKEVGQKVLAFANDQGANAGLISINDDGALYQVLLSIDGQEVPVYATKDGKNLIPSLIPLTARVTQDASSQQATASGYSEEDLLKLKEFNDCLGENGLKIYGADWCGWTQKLAVDTLGGFDTASAVYIECTQETKLCKSEEVQGYPTIKLNGEIYEGERTIEVLAQATGCLAPTLTGTGVTSTGSEATC